ncbi:RDD domain-containing protein [Halobiforma nitratireducens JCM 10879]|uniref:RDD domain-containing protein n=1 Tax=Halobiforma nitratireducens JCM 10879 TaxID=1227454 RepID=M0M0L1_9EURY|nr:RDD domain-containing protein [Halobiforma nitratireducens JCM 10879]
MGTDAGRAAARDSRRLHDGRECSGSGAGAGAAIRNVTTLIGGAAAFPGLVAIVPGLLTDNNQRLGDILGDTTAVRTARRHVLLAELEYNSSPSAVGPQVPSDLTAGRTALRLTGVDGTLIRSARNRVKQ